MLFGSQRSKFKKIFEIYKKKNIFFLNNLFYISFLNLFFFKKKEVDDIC
jgi:plastocyanin domain-containing protein